VGSAAVTANDFGKGHDDYDRMEINPKVMMGKPVIRGTRMPVEFVSVAVFRAATG
jgi:uncharacterized protein (DUF433 family)